MNFDQTHTTFSQHWCQLYNLASIFLLFFTLKTQFLIQQNEFGTIHLAYLLFAKLSNQTPICRIVRASSVHKKPLARNNLNQHSITDIALFAPFVQCDHSNVTVVGRSKQEKKVFCSKWLVEIRLGHNHKAACCYSFVFYSCFIRFKCKSDGVCVSVACLVSVYIEMDNFQRRRDRRSRENIHFYWWYTINIYWKRLIADPINGMIHKHDFRSRHVSLLSLLFRVASDRRFFTLLLVPCVRCESVRFFLFNGLRPYSGAGELRFIFAVRTGLAFALNIQIHVRAVLFDFASNISRCLVCASTLRIYCDWYCVFMKL